jgi:cell division protein FtsQ
VTPTTGTVAPSPLIDPRIQARREEVAEAHHRRRRRWWLVVLVVAVLAVAGWSLTRSPLLDVDQVEVVGASRTTVDEVMATAAITPGQPLIDVDASAVADRLRALPWVAGATVDVGWRGQVDIELVERVPVALATGTGPALLVDATGHVVGRSGEGAAATVSPEGLVVVEGLAPAEPGQALAPPAGDALAVAAALGPDLRSRVEAVVVGPDGALSARLRPSGEAVLGTAADLDAKVRALETTFAQVVDWCLVTVDLRVAGQVAITRDQACLQSAGQG